MRRLPLALGALLFALAARAQELAPAPAAADTRSGYAFDYPRVLAQQRLFGLAHGIALLAAACRAVPAAADASQAAYAAWRTRQGPAIAAAAADLNAYYFGNGSADWQALAQKMGLKYTLDQAPDSVELGAACATLPEALGRPRYDLAARLRLEELIARVAAAATIEARAAHCGARFTDDEAKLHAARYAVWREINAPILQQATTTLTHDWPEDAPAASFADWLTELRRTTPAGGSLNECRDFSASLKQPETALRNAFNLPPPRRGATAQ